MPDDLAPDTPDTPTPADTDWQSRYQSLQPEYTRTTQALKDHESVWEDEQALLVRIAEKFPHLLEEEETPQYEEDDEDDPVAPLRTEMEQFKAWQQQVENDRGAERFAKDLKAELGDQPVPARVTDWIKDRTASLGNNPAALKKAVEEYREFADELRGPTRRTSPTPPQPGKAGEPKRDPRNREQRRAAMAAAIEAANQ